MHEFYTTVRSLPPANVSFGADDERTTRGMRLEIVGLDGATAYVSAEEVGRTVGSLRRWVSAQAGLPSPSLLRLKSGCRDLLL